MMLSLLKTAFMTFCFWGAFSFFAHLVSHLLFCGIFCVLLLAFVLSQYMKLMLNT